ncbi:cobalt-precorrin-5B (C1)-methyltransferase [Micromonospora pattaloongensis]|uniref:Cobalt-precorrin-5B C(1)-methyltransferase n=1 Tax=Micromonospora pattaloongensis TaxID=405436 RepID=A0A1H3NTX9_9ACTN|nr:cobalt-precorrin-5B (C(1))-methyltransferase [Micromonospora pattaloongensis]SDY92193.1 cobalt-precorrin-5B (C1)-methyltransferase [Micromonospora pattaloongensis]
MPAEPGPLAGAGGEPAGALPPLREPDLPRTAKVRPKALRTGWTTGTCASAAAKAAALLLTTGVPPRWVEIGLPSGRRVTFAVERAERRGAAAEAVVVKDAGDDPDVTHGAHLTACVAWRDGAGVELAGGDGVGTVTRPGLGLDVGGPAINPVPREMITQAVTEVVGGRGTHVVISVPDGERMARKTTNRRLGILGGISILGTTGIVRPFSTASWRASVVQAVRVAAAQGEPTIVLCTGGRTEKGAMALLPELPEVCFVEVGDFTGAALRTAAEEGMRRVVFVGMVGKLTKLAAGILMTHYTRSRVDTGLLGRLTRELGGDPALAAEVDAANTARHAYELWESAGLLPAAGHALCARVRDVLTAFTAGVLTAEVAMVDFTGRTVVAATTPEWLPC